MARARSLARSIGRFLLTFFPILGFWVHLIVFGEQYEMATFVAKNSGGVKKKPK